MIDTLFPNIIGPLHHPVAFIIIIRACCQRFFVLVVNLPGGIAPFVIAVICPCFPSIIRFCGNLVQIVQLIVHFYIVVIPLIGQVPQAVILVVAQILTMGFMGLYQPKL